MCTSHEKMCSHGSNHNNDLQWLQCQVKEFAEEINALTFISSHGIKCWVLSGFHEA